MYIYYCTHTLHYNYNYGAYLCSIIIVAVACTNMVVIGACCDVAANMAVYIIMLCVVVHQHVLCMCLLLGCE